MDTLKWTSACNADSQTGNCIEVAPKEDFRLLRTSSDTDRPWLLATRDEFREFLAGAKAGRFDHLI